MTQASAFKPFSIVIVSCGLLISLLLAGCASNKPNEGKAAVGVLPRPTQVIIHDFALAPHELPPDSAFARKYMPGAVSQNAQQMAVNRALAAKISELLVEQVRGMGMPAVHGAVGRQPQINNIMVRGYLVSNDERKPDRPLVVGIGSGNSRFRAVVEGFEITMHGMHRLGSGATADPIGLIFGSETTEGVAAGGGNVDALAKTIAAELASTLKQRFQEQGWIN